MTDWLNVVLEKVRAPGFAKVLVDHNRGLFLGMIVTAVVAISVVGCKVTTTSPISGKPVTQDQLDAEASIATRDLQTQQAVLTAKAADLKDKLGPAYADLERKREAASTVVGTVSELINQYVPGPWQGVAATGFSALLLGLGLDNRRKDRLIGAKGNPTVPVDPAAPPMGASS
jgi:hypothetical protein